MKLHRHQQADIHTMAAPGYLNGFSRRGAIVGSGSRPPHSPVVLAAAPAERPAGSLRESFEQLASGAFEEHFPVLQSFVSQKGRLPTRKECHEGLTIGKWRHAIAFEYRQGLVLAAHAELLETVPGWKWGGRKRFTYMPIEGHLKLLTSFIKQHGRLPKRDEEFGGRRIGEWCVERRSDYRHGRLSDGRLTELIEQQVPEWEWDLVASSFSTSLDLLVGFVAEHGRMPTQRETFNGKNIGAWVNKKRLAYRSGKISAEQVEALEAVPGWWWSIQELYGREEKEEQLTLPEQSDGGI